MQKKKKIAIYNIFRNEYVYEPEVSVNRFWQRYHLVYLDYVSGEYPELCFTDAGCCVYEHLERYGDIWECEIAYYDNEFSIFKKEDIKPPLSRPVEFIEIAKMMRCHQMHRKGGEWCV